MKNKLKKVTYLTLKELKKQEVIVPVQYSKVFQNVAKKLQITLDKEDLDLENSAQDAEHVEKIVKKTSESLTSLNKSTSDARQAIENKDEESLKKINEDLVKMQKQIDFLQKELFSDPLTGAYNRKWFFDYYLKDQRFQNNGFIAFIDLDKFKNINDTYGHLIGDQVLKYIVKFLLNELPQQNTKVIRYAGDEFIILFDMIDTSKEFEIDNLMKELQIKLSKIKLKSEKIKELTFSFSYGVTAFKKGLEIEPVLELVDGLMYKDKEANR